jgi:hypothetical protein
VLLPAWHPGPAGVLEHGERPPGFPSNRRDLLPSLALLSAAEVPNLKPPGPPRLRLDGGGSESQTHGGIAGRAQEPGETGWQESEPFLVPWTSGNSSRGDPAEGREGRVAEPLSGDKARTPSLSHLVHETAADSVAGQ